MGYTKTGRAGFGPWDLVCQVVCPSLVSTVGYYKAVENDDIDLYLLAWKISTVDY